MNLDSKENKLIDPNFKLNNKYLRSTESSTKLIQEEKKHSAKAMSRQILSASGAFVSTLSSGMTAGFSAVLLPQLMKNNSITENQASWIASIAVLPMALGCIVSGILMERFGRLMTIRIGSILFTIGWAAIGLSNNYESICVGRMLTGLCTGLLSPVCLVYIAEISEPSIRGVMLSSIPFAISTGILLSHIFGTVFHWKIAALICAAFPTAGFIIMFFVLDSPSWLILKGHTSEGEAAFRKLRGFSAESSDELKSMLRKNHAESEDKNSENTTTENVFSLSFIKPLIIMMCFFFIQQFSGVNAVIFYSVSILYNVSSNINEYLSTIIIDIVRVIMSAVASILLTKFKRRVLAVFSTLMTGLSLLGFIIASKVVPKDFTWVSLIFITAYVCFMCIGTVPIPWILTGEIFPRHIREIGSGFSTCFAFIMFFIVVKTSPNIFKIFGTENTFLIFASVSLAGSIFLYFFLPETKNVALHKIENKFIKKESTSSASDLQQV